MTSTLPGRAAGAPVGARGADTVQVLGQANVQMLAQNGYQFCVRYVNLSGCNYFTAITNSEANTILSAGLSLMIVQAARTGEVTSDQGTSDGSAAVEQCQGIGLPGGVNIWLDLESVNGAVFDYANCWYTQVLDAGYVPGIYVGDGILNNGAAVTENQLYANFAASHYWRSQSAVPNVATRGYQMLQLYPQTSLADLTIDVDVTQNDYMGGTVQWLSPQGC